MKKYFSFAVTAIAILGLGSLTSCHDEDFDVSTAVLQERAFEQGFIKEFGQPSADQSWDFYAQMMESLRHGAGVTRATMDINVPTPTDVDQPTDDYFKKVVKEIAYALEENHNNANVGQNDYSLVSTGEFDIYAVRYAGHIQTNHNNTDYKFVFGFAYMDDGEEVKVPLFGTGTEGNPGFGKHVKIPKGTAFYFYISYVYPFKDSSGNEYSLDRLFYSNQTPSQQYNVWQENDGYWYIHNTYRTQTFDDFSGTSTLLYSVEHKDEAQGVDEQVMLIGIEDGWGYGYSLNTPDYDFNDVVVVIEGSLPVPTSKRFFCEDKEKYDWDYNDVVFDVSNTGIVLRAVGGTLPVFLRVTDRNGKKEVVNLKGEDGNTYCELHELMRSQQFQTDVPDKENPHKNAQLTYTRDGKTYYRPIDAGISPQGLWLDPVEIVTWTISMVEGQPNTRLEEGEVELFANPLVDAAARKGDVELIVLPQSQYSSTGYDVNEIAALSAFAGPGDDPDAPKIIKMTKPGEIPAMWSAPVSVVWMKELQKITKGYPDFYGGGTIPTGEIQPQWWVNVNNDNKDLLYDYKTDGGDTYNP